MKCPQHYLTEMQEVILFYNGLDVPNDRFLEVKRCVHLTATDVKKDIQEMVKYSQKWHNGTSRGSSTETSDRLAAILAQLNNLGRKIKKVNEKVYAAQAGCEQLGELAHTKLIVELADRIVKYLKGIAENVLVRIGKFTFPVDFIILDMPDDIKVPLILGRLFLSTARAKIDVYKRKITLRVGEEKIIFKSFKSASSLIKRVYKLSLRERMDLDLDARLMGETLVLYRSLDHFLEDYI
ncbi:putative reverse transcriptase domain-containing protein [Tanacetum coccineum]